MFQKAIVCEPGRNFAAGLTTVALGRPNYELARQQHQAYCRALEHCGLTLLRLAPDERQPDSTFVEDTAVLTERGAVLTRPGAPSRSGETAAVERVLDGLFAETHKISSPGTVDGGDICEADDHFFIGISQRTNPAGAEQLAGLLASFGYSSSLVDIRGVSDILHLKSGIAYLKENQLLIIDSLSGQSSFAGFDLIKAPRGEEYAANCVEVNDFVLVAAGFPETEQMLRNRGLRTVALEMSEFQKMDGGLSCLSLRF
jgi:dimethylargininase